MKAPIVLAVDTPDLEIAKRWVSATQSSVSVYKLGLEFFSPLATKVFEPLRTRLMRIFFSISNSTTFHILSRARRELLQI